MMIENGHYCHIERRAIKEDVTNKMTLEQRPKGGEGISSALFRGETGTGEFPEARTGVMCLKNGEDDSFVVWRVHLGTPEGVKPEAVGPTVHLCRSQSRRDWACPE